MPGADDDQRRFGQAAVAEKLLAVGKGRVKSPLLLWGPYLWAGGEKGRKIDGLVWKPDDLGPDGTHPSDSGRRKVAELLLWFVKTDPTVKAWFTQSDE